jgi:1,4-dihydroxy-2-naphthoate octaprenyltransferase
MAFLIVFFTVALSLCVLGLVSLWWSWLFLVAILESVRGERKLKEPEREARGQGTADLRHFRRRRE